MPCLLVIFALATPRLVIAVLWFFTNWFNGLFDTALWPVLGFLVLPTSFLWFTAVQRWFGGEWTLWPIVGLVIALMIDVSPAGGRRAKKS
jgi:membrane protease YdiL (CAAX protease family)